jgi:hypothetical protein
MARQGAGRRRVRAARQGRRPGFFTRLASVRRPPAMVADDPGEPLQPTLDPDAPLPCDSFAS